MSREQNQRQLHILMETTGYVDKHHPVLTTANKRSMVLDDFLSLTIKEVDENRVEDKLLKAASDRAHEKLKPSKSWLMEFVDIIVMLRAVRDRIAPSFLIDNVVFSSNGSDGSFDSIENQILSLNEGNVNHNFKLLFASLLALLKHTNIDLQADVYSRLTNIKLDGNKQSDFYQIEPGMSEADILKKYEHVTAALKILRNFFKKVTGCDQILKPWMTDFFVEEILDWRHSELATIRLRKKIPLLIQKVKDEIFCKLIPEKEKDGKHKTNNRVTNDPSFEIKMLIAGARELTCYGIPLKPLQANSKNATVGTRQILNR